MGGIGRRVLKDAESEPSNTRVQAPQPALTNLNGEVEFGAVYKNQPQTHRQHPRCHD